MRSDSEIKEDVLDELMWQPNIDETQIGVIVEKGVVTLTGFVDAYAKKTAALDAVKNVKGVKAVANDIEVKYGTDYKKTDNFYRIAKWQEGKSIYPHKDTFVSETGENQAVVSLVMYLTDKYEGGILTLTQFEKEIRTKAGDILVFNSDTYHEISTHLGGERITARIFLYNK